MAENECKGLRIIDPVEGLLEYIENVKPFHTKIAEVLVEYAYNETLAVSVNENFYVGSEIEQIQVDEFSSPCEGGFSCGQFGSPTGWTVLSPNPTISLANYPVINDVDRHIVVLGDRSLDIGVGDTFELVSNIEDVSAISKIIDMGADYFIVENAGLYGTTFDAEFATSDVIYTTGMPEDDERAFNIVDVLPDNPAPGYTRVNVAETINNPVPIGYLGLQKIVGSNNGNVFSVNDVTFSPGNFTVYPHTFISVNEPITALDDSVILVAHQSYQIYLRRLPPMPVSITKVLSYSGVTGSSTDSPDEGIITKNVIGATISTLDGLGIAVPGSGNFRVSGNITGSNIFPGEWLHVEESLLNNGTYIITDITYDVGNDETIISVTENVRDDTADGIIRIDIPSNMFYVHGNLLSFFRQGVDFYVTGGTYAGEYTSAYADFVNGNTRVRPIQEIINSDDGFEIQNVPSMNSFDIDGDKTSVLTAGSLVNIVNSLYNNGMYTVNSSAYAPGPNTTTVTVDEDILDFTADGVAVHTELGDINNVSIGFSQSGGFCGFPGDINTETSLYCSNVLSTAAIFDEDFKVDWGTSYAWAIISTNAAASQITVRGDISFYLPTTLDITNSQGIDGTYTIVSHVVNTVGIDPEDVETVITVSPILPTNPPAGQLGLVQIDDTTEVSWFQFMIHDANSTTNTFTVRGDATGDIENLGTFRVVGTSNNGLYTATGNPVYNSTFNQSTIQVSNIANDATGGWVDHV